MSSFADAINALSPLSYWRLNETGDDTTAQDATANNRDGTYSGTPVQGGAGLLANDEGNTSVAFDGVDDYVHRLDQSAYNTSLYSVVMVIQKSSNPGGAATTLSKIADGYSSISQDKRLMLNVDGTIGFYVHDGGSKTLNHPLIINNNERVVICATVDGTNINLYVNDETPVSLSAIGSFSSFITATLYAAGHNNVTGHLEGIVDEIAAFDYAISPAEYDVLYDAAITGTSSDPTPNACVIHNSGGVVTLDLTDHQIFNPLKGLINVIGLETDLSLSIPIAKGNVQITGNTPIVNIGLNLPVPKGNISITGKQALLEATDNYLLTPAAGQIDIVGKITISEIGHTLYTTKGQINIVGRTPIYQISRILHTTKGQINIAGKTPLAEIVLKLNLLESIDVEDTFTEEVFIIRKVVEQLFVTDIVTTHHNGTVTITDTIAFKDRLYFIISELLTESITNTDIPTALHIAKQSITEAISLTDIVTTQLTMKNILVDVINIIDLLIPQITLIITESITVEDSVDVIVKMITEIVESITLIDTATAGLTLVVFASDSITLTDIVSTKQIFNLWMTEEVVVYGDIVIDDEHYTFVMNTKTKGISEYTNYNFNSMSEGLAATATGIYLLEGDDDAGTNIDALIKTGLVDFGTSKEKQIPFPYAYIGLSKSGEMILKTVVDYRGERKEYQYTFTPRSIEATDTVRVRMGKGVKSRYWQFELANVDGSDFELDSLELLPLTLKRRI